MMTLKSTKRFSLGQLAITRGAINEIPANEVWECLRRHAEGDWGDLCEEDWMLNDDSLQTEQRLLSSYRTANGVKFWIITEWDRSLTTILLPEEY